MRRAVLAVLFLVAPALVAATFDRVTDAQIIGRADLVVVATVESAASRAVDRSIVTDYRLRIVETLRGNAPAAVVTVTELGGSAGELIMVVPGAPSYEPGARVVAFLRARGDGSYVTAYMGNGALRYVRDTVVRTNDEGETAYPAKEYLDFVRGTSAHAPQPLPRAREPRAEASASAYSATGGSPRKPIRWPGCEGGCNIEFVLNGSQDVPNPAGGVENALAMWTNDATSFVNMTLDGLTNITSAAQDGFNTILLDNASAAPLAVCDGAIACGMVWAVSTPHNFDGDQFYTAIEADVVYRPGSAPQQFFEAILAHELGHGLALRHSNEQGALPNTTNALMNSSVPTNLGATMRDYDIEAMAEVYGNGVACVVPAVTNVSGGGTIQYNSKTTLSATVTGSTPRTFQWYEGERDDTSAPVGFNQSTFLTPNITVERRYWVKVSNECGFDRSQTIVVQPTECNRPQITTEPLNQRIQPGQTATLTADASGTTPLTYAWYEGLVGDLGKKVGTNSKSFKTPALNQTTSYWLRVSNACGHDDSVQVTITVGNQCVPPTISQQPANAQVSVGSKATLHVSASGDAPITFQWYEGESGDTTKPVDGATSAVFEPGPFAAAGTFTYWARATNACNFANSNAAVITAVCVNPQTPVISSPPVTPRDLDFDVSWTGSLLVTPEFELQEADNPQFNNAQTYVVTNALKFKIPAHSEITGDRRFYYRVRAKAACNGTFTPFSNIADTLITVPAPSNSTEFVVGVPEGTTQPFKQSYLVPGFGATATNGDTFTITTDVPWITVFPASGALSAGGTTVQLTINPSGLPVGSNTGTIVVTRNNPVSGRISTHGTTTANVPFSISLVTPVTPAPRDTTPPAGTLIIPAIAHADGIGTRFQSDIRIANAANEPITYEISFTPSASNGLVAGKKTTLVIPSNQTTGLDDVVKVWFGSGTADTALLGTLEIRPLKLASGGAPSLFSTFASSRTYAISPSGTLGQFIPALPLSGFIGDVSKDALARISLQQIANNNVYRTNLGFTEGSGAGANLLVKLFDTNNNLLKSVPLSLTSYEHRQMNFGAVFGNDVSVADGRVEVEVTSATGKVTAYASVLDNNTTDPLLVFPVQAGKVSATRYVVPGVAELNTASNFHTDMRLYNPSANPVVVSMTYKPQRGDSTPVPAAVTRTINAGQVLAIDNVLPSLWNLNASGGAVTVTTSNATPLVITARTFSREPDGGTYGQFIPAVTAGDAVGLGERAIEVLQLEDSANFRSNVGLVEVTGNPATVEVTMRTPDALQTAVVHFNLAGGEFMQIGRIFKSAGYPNVYNGRVSMRVIAGNGRVSGYGSVVDNRTQDPTYVPSQ